MDQILDKLYLGSRDDAEIASEAGITRLLTLSERLPTSHVPSVHLPLADEVYHAPLVWHARAEILHLLLHQGDTVLVHCRLGVSRSPSLVALYLAMIHPGMTLEEALVHVVARRAMASPHQETWRGVQDCYALMTQKAQA